MDLELEPTLDNSNKNPFAVALNNSNEKELDQQQILDELTSTPDSNLYNKQNGTNNKNDEFYNNDNIHLDGAVLNGKRLVGPNYSEECDAPFDEEDMMDDESDDYGPETDVDNVDCHNNLNVMSPTLSAAKALADGIIMSGSPFNDKSPIESESEQEDDGTESPVQDNKQMEGGSLNPFEQFNQVKEDDYARLEADVMQHQELHKNNASPTPVLDGSVVVDNVGESGGEETDDEDGWNYIHGDKSNSESGTAPVLEDKKEIKETAPEEEEDDMSQLNPDAAEFVPISPVRSASSPTEQGENICSMQFSDTIISQSPKKPKEIAALPNSYDFLNDVSQKPSEMEKVDGEINGTHVNENDIHNGHSQNLEAILNGKNVDEIEFHPTITSENFEPSAVEDVSEVLSTAAVYGDDTGVSNMDPMSMSFYAENDADNIFNSVNQTDLNAVQLLPDNLDEFIGDTEKENYPQPEFKSNLIEEKEQESPMSSKLSDFESEVVSSVESPLPDNDAILHHELSNLGNQHSKSPSPIPPELTVTSEIDEIIERITPSESPVQQEPVTASPVSSNFGPPSPVHESENFTNLVEDALEPELVHIESYDALEDQLDDDPLADERIIHDVEQGDLVCLGGNKITPVLESFVESPLPEQESLLPVQHSPLPVQQSPVEEAKSPIPDIEIPRSPIPDILIETLQDQPQSPVPTYEQAITPEVEQAITPDVELAITPEVEQAITPELEQPITPDVELAVTPEAELAITPEVELAITPDVEHAIPSEIERVLTPESAITSEIERAVTPEIERILSSEIPRAVSPDLELAISSELQPVPETQRALSPEIQQTPTNVEPTDVIPIQEPEVIAPADSVVEKVVAGSVVAAVAAAGLTAAVSKPGVKKSLSKTPKSPAPISKKPLTPRLSGSKAPTPATRTAVSSTTVTQSKPAPRLGVTRNRIESTSTSPRPIAKTNGEVKPRAITKPSSATTGADKLKPSVTKAPIGSRLTSMTRPASATSPAKPSSLSPKPASGLNRVSLSKPKTLAPKVPSSTVTNGLPVKSASSTTTKPALSSAKLAPTLRPKVPSSVAARTTTTNRVPLVKKTSATLQGKLPPTEKQIKETANKQLSSRTTTVSRTSSGTAARTTLKSNATSTTGIKKSDVKSLQSQTNTKSGTNKQPPIRKPATVTRTGIAAPKATLEQTSTSVSLVHEITNVSITDNHDQDQTLITTNPPIESSQLVKDESDSLINNLNNMAIE